ncbi:MAG TPA: dihydroorotase [Methanoregulaceae archaeon]|nr:dihydroorotase [Methanoregulaceae archaeon]
MAAPRCDLVLLDVCMPDGRRADISVRNGLVAHVGASLPAYERVSGSGMTVVPAAVDMHVHMRGGIQDKKEDWKTGSMSALAGGVTVVVDQPNTLPPLMNPEIFESRVAEAMSRSLCSFAVNGGVSRSADMEGMWRKGAMAFGEIFAAPSSYGESLPPEVLAESLEKIQLLGAMATIHAEKVLPGPAPNLMEHNLKRSILGEIQAVKAVQSVNNTCCTLHFCHLSNAGAVDAVGKATREVTPHHLFLSLEHFDSHDARGKVNPPLRTGKERRELWARWDMIDSIASDHAPHMAKEKEGDFESAPSGIPGVETMIPLLMAQMREGKISLASIMEKTSYRPCEILGLPRAGFSPGNRADFGIYPREQVKITSEDLHSKAGWTPFEGFSAIFPEIVIMNGGIAFRKGEFLPGKSLWYPGRGYIGRQPTKNGADTAHP